MRGADTLGLRGAGGRASGSCAGAWRARAMPPGSVLQHRRRPTGP
eukprot:CAMPEP_0113678060 /NCGR_PEP_ID=MMETSP0038_2-20120614/9686_1 /TAXON_ID=2898 /ORGANISM="Cryptomonas paramecium" /LENGTH=44 /DNA_ID=CAMNT_0000595553 /DNA_START=1192 /DNA_END=1326 /DNA_ORIENTATION=+ /assembly_acc=CAM_ASM_000170